MRPWHRKLVRDTLKALIPFQSALRAAKRRISPYRSDPDNDRNALEDGLDQIDLLRQAGARIDGAAVLELGTGWKPIVPFLFRAAGAKRIWLTDVERLIDAQTFRAAAQLVASEAAAVGRRMAIPPEAVEVACRLPDSDRLNTLLASAGMTYAVPFAPGKLADGSIDIVVSRAVLEHVRPAALVELLAEFRRMLRRAGYTCHIVDNSDHWEHGDKTISRLNFLRYGDGFWRLTGLNVQNYQNRLRHGDYVELFRKAGFDIVRAEGTPDARALADLSHMALAERFRGRPHEDLAILTSKLVARTPSDQSGQDAVPPGGPKL